MTLSPNAAERLFDEVLGSRPYAGEDEDPWPGPWPPVSLEGEREPLDARRPGEILVAPLAEGEAEEIGDWVEALGVEVLAFYKSYRFRANRPFPGHWGIFYPDQGLGFVARAAAQTCGAGLPQGFALDFLWSHEFYHYKADLATLCWEEALAADLFLQVVRHYRRQPHLFVEEALANRDAVNFAKRHGPLTAAFARAFCDRQPGAYARYGEQKAGLVEEWLDAVIVQHAPQTRLRSAVPPTNWRRTAFHQLGLPRQVHAHAVSAPRHLVRRGLCPEHVVRGARLVPLLRQAFRPPPVVRVDETKRFQRDVEPTPGRRRWESTKQKLLADPTLPGLNMIPWPDDGQDCYSVRINDNNRAHLQHRGAGEWSAYACGTHKRMGHG